MSTNSTGHKKGKTRSQVHCSLKLKELVGIPKNLDGSEVPTLRAALQQGMFIKEKMLFESDADTTKVKNRDVCKEVSRLILQQWQKSNAQFVPLVVITLTGLVNKLDKLWTQVEDIAWERKGSQEKGKILQKLD